MKNFNLFMNEKKEKLKIAGSIVGGITIIALSSCNISDVKNDDSSIETSTLSISTTNEGSSVSITSSKTDSTKKETTTQTTTTSTTTKAPETITTTTNEIITPAPITTNIPATEKPIESTTKTVTTKEPIKTTIVTTTEKLETTTTSTSKKIEKPIEYNTRTDEIKGYYNNTELNDTKVLTEKNINNYEDFLSVANNFCNSSLFSFVEYNTYANLDTGKYEKYKTDSYLERILLLTLLNEKYISDDTLKKILKPYNKNELDIILINITYIFESDITNENYYDYSKIIVDNNLSKILNEIQNSYKKNDYKTVENLCNQNFGKNDMADILMLIYEYNMPEISEYITDENSFDLSLQIIDKTGIYERAHQKTLVLQ